MALIFAHCKHLACRIAVASDIGDVEMFVVMMILEAQSLVSSQVLEDQEKVAEEIKKDASELGIEVIDQISAIAG